MGCGGPAELGGDVQSKATMTTSINPIKDTVQAAFSVHAALFFAKYKKSTLSEYCWACDIIEREMTEEDKERACSQLAAAARILADEVERLRAELNT